MRLRRVLIASLVLVLFTATGAFSAPERTGAIWAGSDGRGSISLFWLPTGGRWPQGGYRLERVTRKKSVVIAASLRPGSDAGAMGSLDPSDAEAIRRFAEKILAGALTEDERRDSIAVMGRKASAIPEYGRALGIRHTDRDPKGPKRSYRLTALGPGGEAIQSMESEVVDPGRGSPVPRRPYNLRAEGKSEGVALYWADPPPRDGIPVVAYHIERMGPGGKIRTLTPSPLLLDRHLTRGKPDYVHEKAPREPAVYLVRSVDLFGRRSDPASVEVSLEDFFTVAGGPVAVQVSDWLAAQAGIEDGAAGVKREDAGAARTAKVPPSAPKAANSRTIVPKAENARAGVQPRTAASPPDARRSPAGPPRSATPAPPSQSVARRISPKDAAPPETPKTYPGAVDIKAAYTPSPTIRGEAQPAETAPPPPPAPAPPPDEKAPPPPGAFPPAAEFRAKYEPSDAISLSPQAAQLSTASPPSSAAGDAAPFPSGGKNGAEASPTADGPSVPLLLTEIDSTDGKVSVSFRAASPDARIAEIILLRCDSPTSAGVAAGNPVTASAGRAIDAGAEPGRGYWYRLVAVGTDGRRSAPTPAKWVRVAPRAPNPPAEEPPPRPTGLDGP